MGWEHCLILLRAENNFIQCFGLNVKCPQQLICLNSCSQAGGISRKWSLFRSGPQEWDLRFYGPPQVPIHFVLPNYGHKVIRSLHIPATMPSSL